MNKEQIIELIELEIAKIPQREGLCLYYALSAGRVLRKHGFRAALQAGSMQWPIVKPEDDDGMMNTHYAYMWSPDDPLSQIIAATGAMPEMHVWLGLVETQEIIDFSTRHFREAAELRGLTWGTDNPPQYIWTGTQSLPDRVRYTPDLTATLLACEFADNLKETLRK